MQNFPTLFVIMTRLSARLSQGSFVSGVLLRSTERSCNHVMQKNLRPVPPSPPQPPSPPPPPKKKENTSGAKFFRGRMTSFTFSSRFQVPAAAYFPFVNKRCLF